MAAKFLETRDVRLSDLTRYPGNARRGNVGEIRKSIRRHGQYRSLVVRSHDGKYVILAGNHTRDALEAEGYDTARCELIECTDDEALRINAADNKIGELPSPETGERYDPEDLAALLSALGGDFEGTGWTEDDLTALLEEDDPGPMGGGGDPDDAPEPPEQPLSVPGDLVVMGPHRLLVGDSTDPACVARLMGGDLADMVFTDPPYNADYSSRVDKQRRKPWGGIANDAMSDDDYEVFLAKAFACIPAVVRDGAAVYVWTDWHHYSVVERLYRDRFLQKSMIVWDKTHFALGTYYRTQHELCLFGVNGSSVATWNAGHDERDVWSIPRDPTGNYAHPTQKPTALASRALANSSDTGGIVLDLFGGSGSTLIAAHLTGRSARLCELDAKWADVIIRRWVDQTGQAATYEDGSPWPALERAAGLESFA